MESVKTGINNKLLNFFKSKLTTKKDKRESFKIIREITLKNLEEIEKEIKEFRKNFKLK